VDYGVKGIVLAGEEVKVNFWDLAGSKEYLEVRNEFYKDSQGCLLVRNCNRLLALPAALTSPF
jgi:DnaJ family protein C protein 27